MRFLCILYCLVCHVCAYSETQFIAQVQHFIMQSRGNIFIMQTRSSSHNNYVRQRITVSNDCRLHV